MRTPPEAFLIFKEELKKAKLEKEKLQKEYDKKIKSLTEELELLREQLGSQRDMLRNSIEYANRLESEINSLEEVEGSSKKSYH